MKKLLPWLFVLTIVSACSPNTTQPPGTILEKYLSALMAGRYEDAWNYLSATDRKTRPFDEFLRQSQQNASGEAFGGQAKFKVLSVDTKGDQASARVEFSVPDFGAVALGFVSALAGEQDVDKIAQESAARIAAGEIPWVTRQEQVELVREAGHWLIFKGWAEKERKAHDFMDAAFHLEYDGELQAAITKYEVALTLEPSSRISDIIMKKLSELKQRVSSPPASGLVPSGVEG